MNIDAISNGIVIDHITAGRGMELYMVSVCFAQLSLDAIPVHRIFEMSFGNTHEHLMLTAAVTCSIDHTDGENSHGACAAAAEKGIDRLTAA